MFGPLGLPEVLLILVLALLIFGPKRLPEVGRTIGRGLSEFRRASSDLKRTVNAELALDEDERPPTSRRPEGRTRSAETRKQHLASAPAGAPPGSVASETPPQGQEQAEATAREPGDAGGRTPDVPPASPAPTGAEGTGQGEPEEPAEDAGETPAPNDEPATAR
ncbi:MAG: twin-arginine translocase TatA/TatE family subunit [bacterium]